MDTRRHVILGADGLIYGTSLWHLGCLSIAVGPHGGYGRTTVHLLNSVKRTRLAGGAMGHTVEPGCGVDIMMA
jgi:hypothetical protein